jgi:hypothetical protein
MTAAEEPMTSYDESCSKATNFLLFGTFFLCLHTLMEDPTTGALELCA